MKHLRKTARELGAVIGNCCPPAAGRLPRTPLHRIRPNGRPEGTTWTIRTSCKSKPVRGPEDPALSGPRAALVAVQPRNKRTALTPLIHLGRRVLIDDCVLVAWLARASGRSDEAATTAMAFPGLDAPLARWKDRTLAPPQPARTWGRWRFYAAHAVDGFCRSNEPAIVAAVRNGRNDTTREASNPL